MATLLLLTTAMIWGFAFVAQARCGEIGAMTFNGLRFMLGAVSLLPVCLLFEKEKGGDGSERKQKRKKTIIGALIAGTVLFIASGLQQIGIVYTGNPGKSAFITGLYTALTPVLNALLFRRKTPWNSWLGVALATVGLYLLCLNPKEGFSFAFGETVLLIGAFFWAGHILVVDRFVSVVNPLRFSCWQFFVCGAENLLFSLFFERPTAEDVTGALWPILYCGLLSVGVAYTCQIIGQKMSNPTFAAVVFSTESVFAAVGGVLWNLITPDSLHVNQQITPVGVIGCCVIFAGIVLSQIDLTRRPSGPGEESRRGESHS